MAKKLPAGISRGDYSQLYASFMDRAISCADKVIPPWEKVCGNPLQEWYTFRVRLEKNSRPVEKGNTYCFRL